jgi:hypothetical protein
MKCHKRVDRKCFLRLVVTSIWLSVGGALRAAGPDISLEIRCADPEPRIGDPIPIQFIITNHGTNDWEYDDCQYDRSGRMPEFELTTRNASGETLADPLKGHLGFGGGLSGKETLHPGESFTRTIELNIWSDLRAPGKYLVIGKYSDWNNLHVESPSITITMLPRTEQEMDNYITRLTNQVAASREPDEGTVMKLIYTRNSEAAPALIEALYRGGNGSFWASQGLICYLPHAPEVRRELIEVAKRKGLGGGMDYVLGEYGCTVEEMRPIIGRSLAADSPQTWSEGARAAQHFADDSFAPRLSAIAVDPTSNVRDQAIYALASNRTDESVRTLHLLLNDTNLDIRSTTKSAIRTAYQYRGIWKGKPLKPEDFDDSFRRPGPP